MDLGCASFVNTPFTSAVIDTLLVFFTTLFASHLVRRSASGREHLFTSASVVIVAFAAISGFRVEPVSRSISDKVLEPNRVLVIGHRAAGYDAPENTIAAIRQAKVNGADVVELDIRFTKDDIPVIIHDPSVDRTTDGHGLVSSFTFEELRKLNASYRHHLSNEFPGERIPTLEEVTEECLKLGLKIFYDVKATEGAATTFIELFEKYPALLENAMVCSFFPNVIYGIRLGNPNIVTALIHIPGGLSSLASGTIPSFSLPEWTTRLTHVLDVVIGWVNRSWMWYFCGNSALLLHNTEISRIEKFYWEERGVQIIPWTVNNLREKHFYEEILKVSYITDSLIGDSPGECKVHT